MATVNLTRKFGFHKKRDVSVLVALISVTDWPTSGDVYEIAKLPKNSLVIGRQAMSLVASDAASSATADFGVTGSAAAFGNDLDLKTTAGSSMIPAPTVTNDGAGTDPVAGLFNPIFYETGATVILTPTYTGAKTEGTHLFVIEYIEIDKTNGELTEFSATT
jgi:hypothetical protein